MSTRVAIRSASAQIPADDFPILAQQLAGVSYNVWRHELRFMGSVSF